MRASKLLHDYGLEAAHNVPVEVLAFERRMIVGEKALLGSEGRLVRRGSRSYAAVRASLRPEKKRFVLAHEFGHHELHVQAMVKLCDEAAFVAWNQRRPQEWEANVFAAELLMPRAAYRRDMLAARCCFDSIKALSNHYRVTLSAAALRYVELDEYPCAIVFATRGRVAWARVSRQMPWQTIRREGLDGRTGAAECFKGGSALKPEWTQAQAWFFDEQVRRTDRLLEQYVAAPTLNSVLSLLWLP